MEANKCFKKNADDELCRLNVKVRHPNTQHISLKIKRFIFIFSEKFKSYS